MVRKQNEVGTLESAYQERCEAYEAKVAQMEEKQARLRQLEEQLQRREGLILAKKHQNLGLPPPDRNYASGD